MKNMYSIDGLPGITMQGIQGDEGIRGCNTITVANKISASEIHNRKKIICILDDDNDGYVYAEAPWLSPEMYEQFTGAKKTESDRTYFAITDIEPVVGDYILSPDSEETAILQITNLIVVPDIDSPEYPSTSADNINEISAYNAYYHIMSGEYEYTCIGRLCAVVKKIDQWTYTPSDKNMDVEMEVEIETVSEEINNGWAGFYEEDTSRTSIHMTYIENETPQDRINKVRRELLDKQKWNYIATPGYNTIAIMLKNADTGEAIKNITVELYGSHDIPSSVGGFPSNPIGTGTSNSIGYCAITFPEALIPCYVFYVVTRSTDDAEHEPKDRYKSVCTAVTIQEGPQTFYMYSSADIETASERDIPIYIPTINSSHCRRESTLKYAHSVFTVKSSMKDEDKKKIKVIAEFTSLLDGIYHFDSVLADKIEDSHLYNEEGTAIKWKDRGGESYSIGNEPILHDIGHEYVDPDSIPEGHETKHYGDISYYEYEYYNLVKPTAGAELKYPSDGSFSFDSESPRRFNLVIKDFEEGNSGSSYESDIFLPYDVAMKYSVSIYIIVDTGVTGLKRIHLGTARVKSTENKEEAV